MTRAGEADVSTRAGEPPRRSGRGRRLFLVSLALSVAALAAALAVTSTSGGAKGPPSGSLAGISPPTAGLLSLSTYPGTNHRAPDFNLTDQNGRPLSLSQFRGKSVVLSFNDDRCSDVCTLLAEDIVRADSDMGRAARQRVVFLSVNVNPYFPDVGSVRRWSEQNELGSVPNWYFATGPVSALQAVWKSYGVYVGPDPVTRSVTHSTFIEYIGPDGTLRATGDFGRTAIDVDPYAHGMAQAAVDLLPSSEQTAVAGPQAPVAHGSGAGLGQQAPPFTLAVQSSPGTSMDLSALAGKPVVLNFWASTCQNCRSELAAFSQVAASSPKVRFVGIDVADPSPAVAASETRAAGVGYPLLSDASGNVAATYRIASLPTTVYIDSQGKITAVHPGAMSAEQLRYTLDQFFPDSVPTGG